jgi:hypothetical protein
MSTCLVGLNPEVLKMVQRSPLGKALGREKMQFSLELAVARYLESSSSAGRDEPSNPTANSSGAAGETCVAFDFVQAPRNDDQSWLTDTARAKGAP